MKVHKVIKDNQELMLVKVLRVILEHKEIRGNQEPMLVKVLKVLLEHKVLKDIRVTKVDYLPCLLYTSPSPRDLSTSRMPSSA